MTSYPTRASLRDPGTPVRHGKKRARHSLATRRSRRWLWVSVPIALLIFCVVWIGVRGLLAKDALETAQPLVSQLKSQVASMNLKGAQVSYRALKSKAAEGKSLTSDPIWRAAEWVPWIGRNLTVVRQLADVTDGVVDAAGPLVDLASSLNPAALKPQDGAIPLKPFEDAAPVVKSATAKLVTLQKRADSIDADGTIGPVESARTRLVSLLDRTTPAIQTAGAVVPLLPAVLGADGPRTYVVMFQNNAELRSLGGTALSFAVISIDKGKIKLAGSVPAGLGNFPQFPEPVIPVPDGFEQIYPRALGTFIANATIRPSSTTAAEVVSANWKRVFGSQIDGVVSVDAVALSYLLRATGPIALATGDNLDSTNVVSVLLNQILQKYTTGNIYKDNVSQSAFYRAVVSQTFAKLAGGQFAAPTLIQSALQGFTERRLTFWSAHPEEEAPIAGAHLDHSLPVNDASTDGVGIYLNDQVGAKLNYYLSTTVQTQSGVCSADGRESRRFVLDLTSTLPPSAVPGLSPSITGIDYPKLGLARGVQRIMLFFYAPPGAKVLAASVGGSPVEVTALHDTDRPVERITVLVNPGATSSITVDMQMGSPGRRSLVTDVTPLVNPTVRTAAPLDCSTVKLPSK